MNIGIVVEGDRDSAAYPELIEKSETMSRPFLLNLAVTTLGS